MTENSTHEIAPEGAVHVVLVPGFWLGAWAWDDVVPHLRAAGLVPHAVTLPGLRPQDTAADRARVTRDDHVDAVARLVDGLEGDVVLVGHSGGGPVVQQVADRDPRRIARVVYVDTGPLVDGAALNPTLPADAAEVPLPSWDELAEQGSSTDGLDDDALARFRECAVPQPGPVARGPVRVSDPARLDVPTTAVCSSIPSAVLAELANPGPPLHTELGELTDLTYVDLPTGHWPMLSRPADLAAVLVAAVTARSGRAGR
ncbi:alpha/beta fold hydrolase [Cellulosimicrobium marinum]|uniref:alpha/beta fold hydrolase n=1 Tax=Cellulosimicrobium marinum TaxID=1638992 RepID=UPI001E313835|nr:alpha/beta hydrolase [Cellulosimicrobium marinum]MCB7134987.1 alpha/beta hydrolase [Cellulosimicrobium marinum]